jgi:hypothetical protein
MEAAWERFSPWIDWSGLEEECMTGWHRKLHIHVGPFYYVEYGLAQLGATQIWSNSLKDQAGAVAAYRKALSLGGTATLPVLYSTAGARFAFDENTLGAAVALMEETINSLFARMTISVLRGKKGRGFRDISRDPKPGVSVAGSDLPLSDGCCLPKGSASLGSRSFGSR